MAPVATEAGRRGGGVLMYHDLKGPVASGFPGAGAEIYKLEAPQFERHLRVLHRQFPAGPVCLDGARVPARAPFCLTFDDGGASALEIARALAAYQWRAHFFITTGRIGTSGFLDGPGVRALHAAGHVIGSHSETHPRIMSALGPQALDREWRASVARLQDLIGARVTTASVPGGYCAQPVVAAAARAGITRLFTSEPTCRVVRSGPVVVLGRFAVLGTTTAEVAAGLAGAAPLRQWRQWARWQLLRPVKAVLRGAYPVLRQRLLSHKNRISHEHP